MANVGEIGDQRATVFVPPGQSDNSPAYQRRVIAGTRTSPTGTAELHFHKYRSLYSIRCFFSSVRNSSWLRMYSMALSSCDTLTLNAPYSFCHANIRWSGKVS